MNPEIKTKWVAALRSGEYRQTSGTLRNGGGYCCLGVLCDLAVKAGVIPEPRLDMEDGVYTYGDDKGHDFSLLPKTVVTWAELPNQGPEVEWTSDEGYERRCELAVLNDDGLSFDKIADLIEVGL